VRLNVQTNIFWQGVSQPAVESRRIKQRMLA
jgi:hypothetical protein